MPNPYITRKREQADAIKATIDGLQTRAADENRDLTEEELRSIEEQSEQYKTIVAELESLNDVEVRSRQVAEMAAAVNGGEQRTTSNASVVDRDPGHYRSVEEGGQYSFFGDLYKARGGDYEAEQRLVEHNRALSTGSSGAGLIPPKWLASEYAEVARQGRPLANSVRNFPIGDDPRPINMPRQTTTTGVDDQSAENEPVHEETPGYGSAVTPVPIQTVAGKQVVSRQLLDSSNPAIDALIYADLVGELNENIEARVAAAVLAAGPTALVADAGASAVTDASHYNRVALKALTAVRKNRKRPANLIVVSVSRWGDLLGLTDTTGRPLIPAETAGQMNVPGVGTVAVDGRWHGVGVVATDAFEPAVAGEPLEDSFAAAHASDVILFEGNLLRFRFEEKSGPESIELGVWKYVGTHVKYGTAAVQVVDVEAGP